MMKNDTVSIWKGMAADQRTEVLHGYRIAVEVFGKYDGLFSLIVFTIHNSKH